MTDVRGNNGLFESRRHEDLHLFQGGLSKTRRMTTLDLEQSEEAVKRASHAGGQRSPVKLLLR